MCRDKDDLLLSIYNKDNQKDNKDTHKDKKDTHKDNEDSHILSTWVEITLCVAARTTVFSGLAQKWKSDHLKHKMIVTEW